MPGHAHQAHQQGAGSGADRNASPGEDRPAGGLRLLSCLATALVAVSLAASAAAAPEPAGWYAGDIHVHRSCGGTPAAVKTLLNRMGTNDLAAISLQADMGNGEVQNPVTDLPQVTGSDDPISTPSRIIHWDAEWHWDATYDQYEHQALGGHILALGVDQAHQIWEEYTGAILGWARQQGGIAGFAHMQYLDDDIPQSLDCCKPVEYPVEVALGAADFISEDVTGSDSAIRAYYRLLNTGFRPGLAAGTDYPCNGGAALGSLLTYAQVEAGPMNYREWIEGIKAGRTVVSRNGHKEFLNLKANGSATPGDTINVSANATVPVEINWLAKQNMSGTLELVQNGNVIARRQASVTASTPATLTAEVRFTKSGWLAARRMGGGVHKVHTAAVFVLVDDKPIRASATDAQFYVQWIDSLLERTSPGGDWASYFVNSRNAAHARYKAAQDLYKQIALEAGAGTPTEPTLLTTQVPSMFENDARYELGTRFWADVPGTITNVRLYTHAVEGGAHTVRFWRAQDGSLLSGPLTWTITPGNSGWQTFTLPTPLSIAANTTYIVAISNSSDRYYAEQPNGFPAPIDNGHLHAGVGAGVYSTALGTMPTSVWQNTNYFRDIVFAPQAGTP